MSTHRVRHRVTVEWVEYVADDTTTDISQGITVGRLATVQAVGAEDWRHRTGRVVEATAEVIDETGT